MLRDGRALRRASSDRRGQSSRSEPAAVVRRRPRHPVRQRRPADGSRRCLRQTGQVQRSVELPGDLPRFVTRSRDERLIAFVAGPGGLGADLAQLSVLDVESSKVTPITDGQTLVSSPNWSADGRTLYYVAHTGAAMDLWEQRLAADGAPIGEPRPLTAGIGMRNAALSRDGRRLAYSQGRKVGNVWRVPFRPDRPATWADAEQLTFDQAYIECVGLNRAGTSARGQLGSCRQHRSVDTAGFRWRVASDHVRSERRMVSRLVARWVAARVLRPSHRQPRDLDRAGDGRSVAADHQPSRTGPASIMVA